MSFFIRDQIFNNENDDRRREESFSEPNLMQCRMSCDAIRTANGRDKYSQDLDTIKESKKIFSKYKILYKFWKKIMKKLNSEYSHWRNPKQYQNLRSKVYKTCIYSP